jgi:hypothetical protein
MGAGWGLFAWSRLTKYLVSKPMRPTKLLHLAYQRSQGGLKVFPRVRWVHRRDLLV